MPAEAYAAAVRFFGETLGLEVAFDAGNTVELAAGNGDRIQLFGPGHRYFEYYRSHGASIDPLLEVDDLGQASAEPAGGGAELRRAGVRRYLDLAHLPAGALCACSPTFTLPSPPCTATATPARRPA